MSVSALQIADRQRHPKALLSGSLGILSSLLAMAWAIFGYDLPSSVKIVSTQSQNLMLIQGGLAFLTLVGSGLMLARYTAPGGIINLLGSLGTFIIGVYYSTGLANAAQSLDVKTLTFGLSSFYSTALGGTVSLPADRIVSTFMIIPILPIALLLLISGLGGLATFRSARKSPA
jgi:hypothetical protein